MFILKSLNNTILVRLSYNLFKIDRIELTAGNYFGNFLHFRLPECNLAIELPSKMNRFTFFYSLTPLMNFLFTFLDQFEFIALVYKLLENSSSWSKSFPLYGKWIKTFMEGCFPYGTMY